MRLGAAGRDLRIARSAVLLGVGGLLLSLGTCVVPETIAQALFGQPRAGPMVPYNSAPDAEASPP